MPPLDQVSTIGAGYPENGIGNPIEVASIAFGKAATAGQAVDDEYSAVILEDVACLCCCQPAAETLLVEKNSNCWGTVAYLHRGDLDRAACRCSINPAASAFPAARNDELATSAVERKQSKKSEV